MRDFSYLGNRLPRFEVIPTCTDLEVFRLMFPESPRSRGSLQDFTLCYLGSVGPRYLFDDVLDCFRTLRALCSQARLLVINRGYHDYIRERMQIHHIPEDWVEIRSKEYWNISEELRRVDAGIFFYKPGFSTRGTAPTRLGEFLACGVPCLANAGVGDCTDLLEGHRIGVVLKDLRPEPFREGLERLVSLLDEGPSLRERCRLVAEKEFSLTGRGGPAYRALYREVERRS